MVTLSELLMLRTCGICVEDFILDDIVTNMPCQNEVPHIFHRCCLIRWLQRGNECPFYKQPGKFQNECVTDLAHSSKHILHLVLYHVMTLHNDKLCINFQ